MPSDSPLSYQTSMPEYPDVSYQHWKETQTSNKFGPRALAAVDAWFQGNPNYSTWRTNQLDSYNAAMSAYNTWLQTGAGIAASAASGGYNKSYFDGGSSSASPLQYQDVNPGSGASEMAQGLSGLMSMLSGVQGLRMASEQIAGKALENELTGEKIKQAQTTNYWLNRTLGYKAYNLGYQADFRRMQNEAEIYSRLAGTNLGKSDYFMDAFGPGLSLMYDLNRVNKGFAYNRQNADLAFVRAGTALRQTQKEMTHWSAEQKKFYTQSIQTLEKALLDGQVKYLNGQIDWQPVEQQLRKQSIQWGIGLNAANTVISAAKTVVGLVNPLAGLTPTSVGWGNLPNQSHSYSGGFDVLNGDLYPYYH